jgi:hypothetical protein
VKPLDAVNVFVDVIVFDVKSPVFVIDADDKAAVHVILFDDKVDVFTIDALCNVFNVDAPKTFKLVVLIESDCNDLETKAFLLNVVGITLFGKFIDG